MRRIALAKVVLALAAGALAGCGLSSSGSSSSHQVSPKTYVAALCHAVLPFERNIVSHGALLNTASPRNPAASKKALEDFFGAVAADTSTATAQIARAGVPNVKNGQRIAGAIGSAFSRLQTATHRAVSQAAGLPTTSPKAFSAAASAMFSRFRTQMTGIGTSLQNNALSSPELQKAAQSTPACKTL